MNSFGNKPSAALTQTNPDPCQRFQVFLSLSLCLWLNDSEQQWRQSLCYCNQTRVLTRFDICRFSCMCICYLVVVNSSGNSLHSHIKTHKRFKRRWLFFFLFFYQMIPNIKQTKIELSAVCFFEATNRDNNNNKKIQYRQNGYEGNEKKNYGVRRT